MSTIVLSKSTQHWWTDWNPSVGLSNLTQRWRESENLTVVMPYLAQRRPKNGSSTVVLPTLILRWFNIVKLTPTYSRPFQPFTNVGSTSPCRPTVYFEITVIIMLNINWIHVIPFHKMYFKRSSFATDWHGDLVHIQDVLDYIMGIICLPHKRNLRYLPVDGMVFSHKILYVYIINGCMVYWHIPLIYFVAYVY
jgi:hypothetical protein